MSREALVCKPDSDLVRLLPLPRCQHIIMPCGKNAPRMIIVTALEHMLFDSLETCLHTDLALLVSTRKLPS
jgi:hypothetical protein